VPLIVHGEIMGVLNIAKDITSLVKANETIVNTNRLLEAKNIELENANKELLSFNYVASHDLKEPLRKIQTFGKMLLELENKSLSETGKNYLNRMIAAALRMQTLIDALIDFSKVTANEIVYGPTSLQNTITDIGHEFSEELSSYKGRIFSQDLPEIRAVQTLVFQLFFNLIGNSIKYAKKEVDLTIIVTAELAQDVFIKSKLHQGSFWKIIVIDNGIGFDPQYSEKIFDLFQRLHGNLAGFEGSGIGLTICKKIVQNHKGYIYADSALNVGSTFTVLIPTDL
jgi:light-regulated signal transduction histidine kinase (bacteriophytochrome)